MCCYALCICVLLFVMHEKASELPYAITHITILYNDRRKCWKNYKKLKTFNNWLQNHDIQKPIPASNSLPQRHHNFN